MILSAFSPHWHSLPEDALLAPGPCGRLNCTEKCFFLKETDRRTNQPGVALSRQQHNNKSLFCQPSRFKALCVRFEQPLVPDTNHYLSFENFPIQNQNNAHDELMMHPPVTWHNKLTMHPPVTLRPAVLKRYMMKHCVHDENNYTEKNPFTDKGDFRLSSSLTHRASHTKENTAELPPSVTFYLNSFYDIFLDSQLFLREH